MILALERKDTRHRFIDAGERERSVPKRSFEAVQHLHHLGGANRTKQQIIARVERHDRCLYEVPLPGYAIHPQRIGHHHAVVVEPVAQDARDDGRRELGGHQQVCRHSHGWVIERFGRGEKVLVGHQVRGVNVGSG